jgi:hypothetical protein
MWNTLTNVAYDAHSTAPLDRAMESEYVFSVLKALQDRMGDSFSTYSFSVFVCGDPSIQPASMSDPHPRKVLIYAADEKGTLPLELAEHYVAVFKGYLPDDRKPGNIYPLPLGCVNGVTSGTAKPVSDRELGVFFSGHLNRNRIALYREFSLLRFLPEWFVEMGVANPRMRNLLRMVCGTDFSNAFDSSYVCFTRSFADGLSREAYAEKLQNARIAFCPGGFHSTETFRHYEAVRAGCVVISERLPDNELYRDAPILQVDSWHEGIELARELLSNPNRLADLQRQTLAWWNDRWAPEAIARVIQETLEGRVEWVVEPSRV